MLELRSWPERRDAVLATEEYTMLAQHYAQEVNLLLRIVRTIVISQPQYTREQLMRYVIQTPNAALSMDLLSLANHRLLMALVLSIARMTNMHVDDVCIILQLEPAFNIRGVNDIGR